MLKQQQQADLKIFIQAVKLSLNLITEKYLKSVERLDHMKFGYDSKRPVLAFDYSPDKGDVFYERTEIPEINARIAHLERLESIELGNIEVPAELATRINALREELSDHLKPTKLSSNF